jgi:hypothetical protein
MVMRSICKFYFFANLKTKLTVIDANKLKKIQECGGMLKEMVGDEGVLSLAKDGICPHYIITNPITKEESIWFVPSELNQWFEDNYINFNEGGFEQKYTFIHFNKEIHKASGQIPLELSKIKELYHLPIEHVSTPPGIYFLCKEGLIKYIGQAYNVCSRVVAHVNEGIKGFDSVFFITCPINRLTELNKTCKINASQKDIMVVQSILND